MGGPAPREKQSVLQRRQETFASLRRLRVPGSREELFAPSRWHGPSTQPEPGYARLGHRWCLRTHCIGKESVNKAPIECSRRKHSKIDVCTFTMRQVDDLHVTVRLQAKL